MRRQLRIAVIFLVVFTVITGIIYPLVVTGIAQAFFHHQANGSLIDEEREDQLARSLSASHSATPSISGVDSRQQHRTRTMPTLPRVQIMVRRIRHSVEAVQARIDALKTVDPDNNQPIPVDLVTFSASGLDPDISIAAANYQVTRVARYRGLSVEQVSALVKKYTEGRQFGILGEPRVNVLQLNLALDNIK